MIIYKQIQYIQKLHYFNQKLKLAKTNLTPEISFVLLWVYIPFIQGQALRQTVKILC